MDHQKKTRNPFAIVGAAAFLGLLSGRITRIVRRRTSERA